MDDGDNLGRPDLGKRQGPSLADQNRIASERAYEEQQELRREIAARAFLESTDAVSRGMAAHGIYDERIKTLTTDAAAKDMAKEYSSTLIRPDELTDLIDGALAKALEQERLEREQIIAKELQAEHDTAQQTQQQERRHAEQFQRLQLEPRQNRYFAELHETHRIVGEEIRPDRAVPPEQNNSRNERDERSDLGHNANPGVTHQLVDVALRQREESTTRQRAEMERTTSGDRARSTTEHVERRSELSDSRRETDDRARLRQARMQEFGREIEEGFHRELDQDGGRDRGR
jgi:hypothetical protein